VSGASGRVSVNDVEDAAREWNEAASYAEQRPHDEEAWLRANEANVRWRRLDATRRCAGGEQ
jgi:uncharacterized SAM-dependent methyltransferase